MVPTLQKEKRDQLLSGDLLSLLLKVASQEEATAFLNSIINALLFEQDEVGSFLFRVGEAVHKHLSAGAKELHLARVEAFIESSANLIIHGAELRKLRLEDILSTKLRQVFSTMDELLSASRYRLYTIHPEEKCYRGLISVGMDHAEKFGVFSMDKFGRTTPIPFMEPPYELVPETSCYRLPAENALRLEDKEAVKWYIEWLRLGDVNGVPETYTWNFTIDGLSDKLVQSQPVSERLRYSLALSMDVGVSRPEYLDRKLSFLEICLLDRLWSSSLGGHLGALFGGRIEEIQSNSGLSTLLLSETQTQSTRNSPRDILANPTWDVPALIIPSNAGEWVCAEGDPAGKKVYRFYLTKKGDPKRVFISGPTGCGKELVAYALAENGNRDPNKIELVDFSSKPIQLIEPELFGTSKDLHSNAVDAPGIFERNDGGAVILDEVIRYPTEIVDSLLSFLETLEKRRGFRRKGLANKHRVNPDVRIISCGDRDGRTLDDHFVPRLGTQITMPSWYELAPESRVAIVRNHMLRAMHDLGLETVRVSTEWIQFLISDTKLASLTKYNMRYLKQWVVDALTTLDEDRISLRAFKEMVLDVSRELESDAAVAHELLLAVAGTESFPDELILGVASGLSQSMSPVLLASRQIATCTGRKTCKGCLPEELATEIISSLKTETDLMTALYMFWSAVNIHSTTSGDEDNRYRTAARDLTRHWGKRAGELQRKVVTLTHFPLNAFRSSNRTREPGWKKLEDFICRKREELAALSEQVRCTLPAFPRVPYWGMWILNDGPEGGQNGEKQKGKRGRTATAGAAVKVDLSPA